MPSSTSSSSSSAKPTSSPAARQPSPAAAPSSSSSSAQASASSSHAPLATAVTTPVSPPSELSSLALSPMQTVPLHPPSPPKRPRPHPHSPSTLRPLALAALTEDLVSQNAHHGRLPPDSDVFAVPLPSLSTILSPPPPPPPPPPSPSPSPSPSLSPPPPPPPALPDSVLVCAAIFLARLDSVHALAADSASCALVGCVAAAALAVRGGGAGEVLACVEAAAGLDAGEARAYAEIVHVYVGKERVGISVGDFREYDEMLREMVDGL